MLLQGAEKLDDVVKVSGGKFNVWPALNIQWALGSVFAAHDLT